MFQSTIDHGIEADQTVLWWAIGWILSANTDFLFQLNCRGTNLLSFDSFIEQYIAQPQLQINQSDEALSSSELLAREARRRGSIV